MQQAGREKRETHGPSGDVPDEARVSESTGVGPPGRVSIASWKAPSECGTTQKNLTSYRLWVRKFQGLVKSKSPVELGGEDVKAFLTDLAVREGVAGSTQNDSLVLLAHPLGPASG